MNDEAIARYWDDSNEAVAWRCRVVRAASGLSQTAFGEAVGANKELVKSWERGGSQPQRPHLRALREAFQITSDFILMGDWQSLRAGTWSDLRASVNADGTLVKRQTARSR